MGLAMPLAEACLAVEPRAKAADKRVLIERERELRLRALDTQAL